MRLAYRALAVLSRAACGGGKGHPTDAAQPDAPPGCGDGVKSGVEQCDGTDLGSASCATATAPGWAGVLSCTSLCQFNISGCNPPSTTWNMIQTPGNWNKYDVSGQYSAAKGFAGGAVFDGRYLYFVPNSNTAGVNDGVAVRYDTQGGFGASGSWQTFDIATISSAAKGFIGGAYDGRYVYFVPYSNGAQDGTVVRYDTQDPGGFGANSAWLTFDTTTVDATAKGFVTAAFDGRYLYFGPHYNGAYDGVAMRYDTQASFTAKASWEIFDISTANAGAKGFLGTAFDGRYIYYAPYYNGTAWHGLMPRFDTQASGGFKDPMSWSFFNIAGVNGNANGFYSITFDGKYIYVGQYVNNVTVATVPRGGYVARYDTTKSFTATSSWEVFNAQGVNGSAQGITGAGFDGRYVYFSPHDDGTNYMSLAIRFDTQGAGFTNTAAWSVYDTSALDANARGFHGVGFDGQYIYMVPSNTTGGAPTGVVARFNAKSPGWLPLGWHNCFD